MSKLNHTARSDPILFHEVDLFEVLDMGPSINDVGIFSGFLTPPSPMSAVFLVLSIVNFDQFLTPPPSQLLTLFMDGP